MKTSFFLAFAALAVSLTGATPLGARDDQCEVSQFKGGNMCCMECGCDTLSNASCYYCLQNCLCGDDFTSCPLH